MVEKEKEYGKCCGCKLGGKIGKNDMYLRVGLGLIALIIVSYVYWGMYPGEAAGHPNMWMYAVGWIVGIIGIVSGLTGIPEKPRFFK